MKSICRFGFCLTWLLLLVFHGVELTAQRPYHPGKTTIHASRTSMLQKDNWQIIFPGNWINASRDVIYTTNAGGYAVGTNEYGDLAKGQRFIVNEPYTIHEIIFWVGAKEGISGKVDFCIWSFEGSPGELLASVSIPVSEITATDDLTEAFFVTFDPPVRVDKDYVAGIDLSDIGTSKIGLYSTSDGDGNEMNLAWEQWSNEAWHTFLSAWELDIDICIFPNVAFDGGDPDPGITDLLVSASADKHVSCFEGSDAQATATATGGVPPYTWLWSNGQVAAIAEGLPAGTHLVTVTDSREVQAQVSVTITEPPALQADIMATSPDTYNGNNGMAEVTVTGGTPPYLYRWSDVSQQQTASVSNLSAGTYAVVTTDSNGCSKIKMVRLGEPGPDAYPHITYDALAIQLRSGAEEVIPTEQINQIRFEFVTNVDDIPYPLYNSQRTANYPNPFSKSTTIRFELAHPGQAEIIIYDMTGRIVHRLSCQNCPEGQNEMVWDGTDDNGNQLKSGVYTYKLLHQNHASSHHMLLIR